jgi:hypothetical protein
MPGYARPQTYTTASQVSFVPVNNILSNNVQAAIQELDDESDIYYQSTAPSNAPTSTIWVDSDNNVSYIYNGSSWVNTLTTLSYQSSSPSNPVTGQLWVDSDTLALFVYNGSSWVNAAGAGATGGGTNKAFYENDITITDNYTISTNKNAGSFGPVTINSGVTVTVPSGSVWTVI